VRHLTLIALFNRNRLAIRRHEIDRGHWRRDVERNAMLVRQHGGGVGADLVGRVAVRCDSIRPDDHEIDFPRAHQQAGHAFRDDGGADAVADQFPRRQTRPA
jgi:hypothetical protein